MNAHLYWQLIVCHVLTGRPIALVFHAVPLVVTR